MGRVRRVDVGGMVCHGWNRANFRSRLFKTGAHYQDFLALMEEARKRYLTPPDTLGVEGGGAVWIGKSNPWRPKLTPFPS